MILSIYHGSYSRAFSIYADRDCAEQALCELSEASWLQGAVETWHAIAVPYYHHGATNWLGELRDGTTLVVSKADPGGPLAVLTSAGYANPGPADMERIGNFMSMVVQLVDHYRELPGNLASAAFSGARVDGLDGTTLTLWADDTAMRNAAYRPGLHRDQMTIHRTRPFFDRSSFTRARIVSSIGSWSGIDPAKRVAISSASATEA
jgi:hypothetical protein